jgi:hypothetical protein
MKDEMGPVRRDLYFKIIETEDLVHPISTRLHFLGNHFPPPKLDAALRWLVFHGYTGKNFMTWWQFQCQASDLEMHRFLLMAVDTKILVPVVANKNFRVMN